jgi:hypothetical protein
MYYITVKDYNEKEFTGDWNGKYYDQKISKGKYNFTLYRIYVDSEQVHIKKEQKQDLEKLKAVLDVPEKVERCRAYITEALKMATDNELKEEMLRRKLIKPEEKNIKIPIHNSNSNRFKKLEIV